MDDVPTFACSTCAALDNQFADNGERMTESDLEKHIASEHLEWFQFECRFCQKIGIRMATEAALAQHFKEAHPRKQFVVSESAILGISGHVGIRCEICQAVFISVFLSLSIEGDLPTRRGEKKRTETDNEDVNDGEHH